MVARMGPADDRPRDQLPPSRLTEEDKKFIKKFGTERSDSGWRAPRWEVRAHLWLS